MKTNRLIGGLSQEHLDYWMDHSKTRNGTSFRNLWERHILVVEKKREGFSIYTTTKFPEELRTY